MSDGVIGSILLVTSLFLMCSCLICIIRLLHNFLKYGIAHIVRTRINADFPGKFACLTGYVAIIVGLGSTLLVQSSSVFTSALTPLAGIGLLKIERMYPLLIGSNIGTTATGLMTAFTQPNNTKSAVRIALCHIIFNITGFLIFFPISQLRVPIRMARLIGRQACKYRWFAIAYIIFMFFVFPALVFALSMAGWYVLSGIFGPLMIVLLFVIIVNVIQRKCPQILPERLKNWHFLPVALRSLKPYDKKCMSIIQCLPCMK